MQKLIRLCLVLFLVSYCSFAMLAQEKVSGLAGNPVLQQAAKLQKKTPVKKNITEMLELPFIDDFSYNSYYPDNSKWTDNYAYINRSYAILPPTIGVATLDAYNEKGEIHTNGKYLTPFSADTLSSQPINLNYAGNSGIYLSFFYQACGYGDFPEKSDSLILEFLSPENNTWNLVWSARTNGKNDTVWETNHVSMEKINYVPSNLPYRNFFSVQLPIYQPEYLKEGFRFRFRNFVTLAGKEQPSLVSNADFWHLDYVYLDKNRSADDTHMHDVAFVYPLKSFLAEYESVPWFHYQQKPVAVDKQQTFYIRNNDNIKRHVDSLYIEQKDLLGSAETSLFEAGARDYTAVRTDSTNFPTTQFLFESDSKDEASFLLTAKLKTDQFDLKANNTTSYEQKFSNYYAYDDGSAEMGYGLIGTGTQSGAIAYKFNSLVGDTLKEVQMYFTQILDKDISSANYFILTFWKMGTDSLPSDIIYQQKGYKPEYTEELNKYYTYKLDTPFAVKGEFFVGWYQTTENLLNVGMDINRTISKKLYYNIEGEWANSAYNYPIMIRPVFTCTGSNSNFTNSKRVFDTYPNPIIENNFQIRFPTKTQFPCTADILDLAGRVVATYTVESENQLLDAQALKSGLYLVKLTYRNEIIGASKILIQRKDK